MDEPPFPFLGQGIHPFPPNEADVVGIDQRINRGRPLVRKLAVVRLDGAHILHGAELAVEFFLTLGLRFEVRHGDGHRNQQQRREQHQRGQRVTALPACLG